MDGTTEPIVAIIGHPIAGNPSQFAIERSLAKLGLEWRVLSFDVRPENVAKALDGFAVTGIRGVLVDASVQPAVEQWFGDYRREFASEDDVDETIPKEGSLIPGSVDCLFRDHENRFQGAHLRRAWFEQLVGRFDVQNVSWLGEIPDRQASSRDGLDSLVRLTTVAKEDHSVQAKDAENEESSSATESVAKVDLVAISSQLADQPNTPLPHPENWPEESDNETVVIDLTHGHPERSNFVSRGYQYISSLDIQAGTLVACVERWTGKTCPSEVLTDALEEYLGL